MKNKIFLSSMLIMSVAPAMAEDFPSNGYMQENKTYDNAATSTNMDGVYSGTVNAVAEYDIIDYIVNAGQYLPADSETVITCPAGSYCPGISGNVQYNQTTPQGIQTCPTGYASSIAGASSDTECYTACTLANANIAHATAVSGNDYYGAGTDTCEPTACENGWHIKPGLNLTTAIGTRAGASRAYIRNNGQFDEYKAAHGQGYYGLTDNNTWAVDYGTNGMLVGQARCSTQAGDNNGSTWTNPTIIQNLTDETGQTGAQYCYCNVTGYTPNGGTLQSLSSAWVFSNNPYTESNCAYACASECASHMQAVTSSSGDRAFRTALINSVTGFQSIPALCEANTITINWSDASQTDIDANNAGTATYGSDVRTPVKAQTIKGKTFKGWRFSKPILCTSLTDQSTCENNSNCIWDFYYERCAQSCNTITDQSTCEGRGYRAIDGGWENCYWEDNSCKSNFVTDAGGAND